mgnify:CR=1 FL=1
MKDWKAAVRNWNRRSDRFNNKPKSNNPFYDRYMQMEQEEQNK